MEIIPLKLKLKYRNPNHHIMFNRQIRGSWDPPDGTRLFSAVGGPTKMRTSPPKAAIKTLAPRRKSYFCGCGGIA